LIQHLANCFALKCFFHKSALRAPVYSIHVLLVQDYKDTVLDHLYDMFS